MTDAFLTDIANGAGVNDLDAWNAAQRTRNGPKPWPTPRPAPARSVFTGTPSVVVEGPGGSESLGTFPSVEQVTEAVDRAR